jgi:hypothetical protein
VSAGPQKLAALLAVANAFVTEEQYLEVASLAAPLDELVSRGRIDATVGSALLALAEARSARGEMPAHSATAGVSSDAATLVPGRDAAPSPAPQGPRFSIEAEIGRGGLGRVVTAIDRELGRTVALKLALRGTSGESLERFLWEARVTGRLEHPNIVPVHEMGVLPGTGEPYFCMKRIAGRDLREVIREYHRGGSAWTLRRLAEAFRDVCRAVAYAHSKGIVHRDLKPANVMVGDFGETLVVDWGLAKERASGPEGPGARGEGKGHEGKGSSISSGRSSELTMEGDVLGTPSYMPPEQARGQLSEIDERSDVYSLGAILYEILSGRPPFGGRTHIDTLFQVVEQPPAPPSRTHANVPQELEAACLRALAKRKKDRFASAAELEAEVEAYLEGTRERDRRERLADAQVEAARGAVERWQERGAEALAAASKAREAREAVKAFEGPEVKRAVWLLEDRARSLERESLDAFLAAGQEIASALSNAPAHAGARRLRAEITWKRFEQAEASGDEKAAALNRRLAEEVNDGSLDGRLRGDGTLAVRTRAYGCRCLQDGRDVRPEELSFRGCHPWSGRTLADPSHEVPRDLEPAAPLGLRVHGATCSPQPLDGAEVWAWRFEERDRVLVPVTPPGGGGMPVPPGVLEDLYGGSPYSPRGPGLHLGRTPLAPRAWPMGSWLLVLVAPGRAAARLPVFVGRTEAVEVEATLFLPGDRPGGFRSVAAGRFPWQGDPGNPYGEPGETRFAQDALFAVHPVTCREYAEFLSALPEAEGLRRAPRETMAAVSWWPRWEGRFEVPTAAWRARVPPDVAARSRRAVYADADWREDWPVFGIAWADASAYARWASARDGRLYALPPDDLWEKAARGPEGRLYPWGPSVEGHFCNSNLSRRDRMEPGAVTEFPLDESVYGIRGMGGNIQQWCLNDAFRGGRRWTMIRGASWPQSMHQARSTIRTAATRDYINFTVGFRLACLVRLGE